MKRLKKTVPSKNTTRKKNNGGMTYIELLVALSLLVLIVTMFSPMLLSSYDRIYRAGEITSDAFDSRQDIENGLASREDHAVLGFEAKFSSNGGVLANKIYIMAKRVASSFDGLETLYVGGKGKIEIVNNENGLVKDNQSSQIVRLKLTNLAYKDYDVIDDVSQVDDFNKGKITALRGKMLFYICSIFDTKTALVGEVVRKPNFTPGSSFAPYCDLRIDNIDITKSPIEITAYYLNEYGSVKQAVTYLNIQQPDVIFVGETKSDAQYFTLSDAGSFDAAIPVIAGRTMETAPIPAGKTLTDVTFVNAMGPITEGYFSMCGEDGIARRLWHLTDSTASLVTALDGTAINNNDKLRITYKSESVLGSPPYYQYDWAGDMNDLMAYTSSTNTKATIEYGVDSKTDMNFGNNDYIWKNEYNLDNNYFAYNFDGYNAAHGEYRDNHRRISYIIETDLSNLPVKPKDGFIMYKHEKEGYYHNGVDDEKEKRYVYNFNNNKWYTFRIEWVITGLFSGYYGIKAVDDPGSNYQGLVTGLVAGENKQLSGGVYFSRDWAATGNKWGSNEIDAELHYDYKLAYVALKSFNTISPSALVSDGLTQARDKKGSAKVNFTSANNLPGTYESLYLGTLDSYAIINETKPVTAVPGNSGLGEDTVEINGKDEKRTESALINSHIYVQDGDVSYHKEYDQTSEFDGDTTFENGGRLNIFPDIAYGKTKYKSEYNSNNNAHLAANTTNKNGWKSDSNVRFTMGYSSDLYVVYNNLAVRDKKPLETVYSSTYNKADTNVTDSDFRKNMWFPREFLNLTESDTYGASVVAVGYDVGGYSKLYYDYSPEYTTSTDTKFLRGNLDMDADDDGIVDWLEGNGKVNESMLSTQDNKGLFSKTFTYDGKNYYHINVDPSGGEGTQTMLAVPYHISTSTVIDYVCNNGVISVYNAGKTNFTHIGYVKGSATENVRFTSVSVDMLQSTGNGNGVLGAAIGGSNGKLYLAKLTYTNGAIATTQLVMKTNLFEVADFSDYYSSIDAVKAFNVNGTFYILVGGKSANNKEYISLVTVNAGNPASSTVKHVELAAVPYDVTDIILADKYVCFTSHQSGAGTEGCVVIGELFANGSMKNIDTVGWKFITSYHTEFESDAKTGAIKAKGNGTSLPRLKALATSVPVDYS